MFFCYYKCKNKSLSHINSLIRIFGIDKLIFGIDKLLSIPNIANW